MDIIKIDNIEIFANHGVLKEENILGQKFLISLEIYTDMTEAGKTDSIEKAIDYGEVITLVKKFAEENEYKLIETLAKKLTEFLLLKFRGAEKIKTEIKKPWAPVKIHTDSISVIIERGWKNVFLSLGSNMGDKKGYLDFALGEIKNSQFCKIEKVSKFIITKPVGDVSQDDFLNACVKIKTLFTPYELLAFINKTEEKAGRKRLVHWGPRTLDIDIIFYENIIMYDERLKIPHPEMENRAFVLEPLLDIEPFYKHPGYKMSVKELFMKIKK